MASITETAHKFFVAIDTGKGWEACSPYCTPDATFSAQAEPLLSITTLHAYADWMQGLLTVLTDGRYELKSFATDTERQNVTVYAVFIGTHLEGGPVPPTGKTTHTDYVYTIQFEGEKIVHMTKIWNASLALKELGWA
jgi:ketosteroid isomerase-like protein